MATTYSIYLFHMDDEVAYIPYLDFVEDNMVKLEIYSEFDTEGLFDIRVRRQDYYITSEMWVMGCVLVGKITNECTFEFDRVTTWRLLEVEELFAV